MKPSKPFVMPPVRIIPPTLEGQSESSKSLEEWLNTEETVRDLHFGKRTEEHMEYSYKSITNCTFSHIQFSACKLKSCHFTDVRFEHCDLSNISFAESSLFRVEFISCKRWEPICRKQYWTIWQWRTAMPDTSIFPWVKSIKPASPLVTCATATSTTANLPPSPLKTVSW